MNFLITHYFSYFFKNIKKKKNQKNLSSVVI
jgi:hypothetical protein